MTALEASTFPNWLALIKDLWATFARALQVAREWGRCSSANRLNIIGHESVEPLADCLGWRVRASSHGIIVHECLKHTLVLACAWILMFRRCLKALRLLGAK